VDLVIAGDGPEREALKQRAAGSSTIRFVGPLNSTEVAARMRSASAFVLPSRVEALGLTVLEAMASRLPVIASEIGGVPELVRHTETGLLVPTENPDALGAALVETFEGPEAAGMRAAAARALAESLSWDNCVTSYEQVYRSAS
jgi:glycosyltransferase involved in cell wall biosynthesis